MSNVLKRIFSMSFMAIFLLLFFLAIGIATFVENDFGTPVAQKMIYKAWWFEAIIAYLTLSMVYNIYRYKLLQWKKIGSLTFHVSFIVVVIGAAVTRYYGFEGNMLIREGASSNTIISYDTYVQVKAHNFEKQYTNDTPVIFDKATPNSYEEVFSFPGESEPINIKLVGLKEQVKDTLVPVGKSSGNPYLELVTVGSDGRKYNYVKSGEVLDVGSLKIAFNNTDYTDAVSLMETDSGIVVKTPYDLNYFQMSDRSEGVVSRDSVQQFMTKRLYSIGDLQFVFNAYYPSAEVQITESPEASKDVKAVDFLITQGSLSKNITVIGGRGMFPNVAKFKLGNLHYELAYGSKLIQLPFSLFLNDFELKRYPGTNNPSSYSSKVTLIDLNKGLEQPHHIYMNNVLDYEGYRFFQSSYDQDEKGTILSVNHDAPGTIITYIGYLLMGLGFVISIVSPGGRFRFLLDKIRTVRTKRMEKMVVFAVLFTFGLFANSAYGQHEGHDHDHDHEHTEEGNMAKSDIFETVTEARPVDADHANKFGRLVVQNQKGRFQPITAYATDILKKVSRQMTYKGMSATQVFIGIHTDPLAWNLEPFIYVSGSAIREKLNITGKRASLADFFTLDFKYILAADAERARRKKPAERNTYDKDILKTDERFNLIYGAFTGMYLKIMPLPNDPDGFWFSPFDPEHPFEGEDADFMNSIMPLYNMAIKTGYETGNWESANKVVNMIDVFQRKVADPSAIPSKQKITMEIAYTKADVFSKIMHAYLILGLILLIAHFIQIFAPRMSLKWLLRVGMAIFIILAILHGSALGVRWYLSGHAPWSDGYEAVVFIAFVAICAGLWFSRYLSIITGAAAILAWLLLFVASMNAFDPQITDLVPVLQSYWLMIHVAIITGSYAFLGLGAILALMLLIMNFFINKYNRKSVLAVSKEITHVSEMIITVGVFMLTIGTFLGGVWANESWGRYWGWDAKETWALASILLYAIVLHLRFIPFLKNQFAFNVASLWAYSSIIMTFFGVNFYLDGLHSYAQGDPVPFPQWATITIILLLIITIGSGIVWRSVRKGTKKA